MDERAIKRLLIIFVISLIALFIVKKVISRTIIDLNRIAAEKKLSSAKLPVVQQVMPITSDAAINSEMSPVSTAAEAASPELPSASGVGASN